MKIDTLDAISPVDGRYRKSTKPLAPIFGERGLISRRVFVECRNLVALAEHPGVTDLRELTPKERWTLWNLPKRAAREARFVKAYETKGRRGKKKTNHDVSAAVLYIQEVLAKTTMWDIRGWAHFPATSEDVNNIAYALQIRDALEKVIVPALADIHNHLRRFANECAAIPMLGRTHGQPASPTTLGKEFAVFAARLSRELPSLERTKILVKWNGATGNYNAHLAAYPKVNWVAFTTGFINELNRTTKNHTIALVPNFITTQIEPHDTYADLFDRLKRINTVLISLCQDAWRYISDDWLAQKAAPGEHGSSTMPHKVNPIDWENGEGNLIFANGICEVFSRTLPIARLQRHLSDSTVIRNFGVAFAHSLVAYKAILRGIGKISANEKRIRLDLNHSVEVVTEAIQIILRREGVADAYEKLRELSRGKKLTLGAIRVFVKDLKVRKSVKDELLALRPAKYIGLAAELATAPAD